MTRSYSGVLILRTVDEQRAGGDSDPVDVESLRLPDGEVPVLIDFDQNTPIGVAFVHKGRGGPMKVRGGPLRLYADIALKVPLEDQRWPSIAITGQVHVKGGAVTNATLVYVGLVARQNVDTGIEPLNEVPA